MLEVFEQRANETGGLLGEPSSGLSGDMLKERLMAAVDYFNHDPVVHTWTYKLDKAA